MEGRKMKFPTVTGSNLLRQKLKLPEDFQGELNLLFIAFQRWHQMEVDSWIALAEELEERQDGLVYYELPVLQNGGSLYKIFLNEGMRAGIPNPKTRERTITLYLNKTDFRTALDMTDEEQIYVLLVDRRGNEIFRTRGPYTPDGEAALREALGQRIMQGIT